MIFIHLGGFGLQKVNKANLGRIQYGTHQPGPTHIQLDEVKLSLAYWMVGRRMNEFALWVLV